MNQHLEALATALRVQLPEGWILEELKETGMHLLLPDREHVDKEMLQLDQHRAEVGFQNRMMSGAAGPEQALVGVMEELLGPGKTKALMGTRAAAEAMKGESAAPFFGLIALACQGRVQEGALRARLITDRMDVWLRGLQDRIEQLVTAGSELNDACRALKCSALEHLEAEDLEEALGLIRSWVFGAMAGHLEDFPVGYQIIRMPGEPVVVFLARCQLIVHRGAAMMQAALPPLSDEYVLRTMVLMLEGMGMDSERPDGPSDGSNTNATKPKLSSV